MKKTFEVLNVKCGGCANTLKKSLQEGFGEVEVDLEAEPRTISLEIADERMEELRGKLISLGYPMADEDLNSMERFGTTAKSFVSCAIGRMDKGGDGAGDR
jgi:copper chaperone CopZ